MSQLGHVSAVNMIRQSNAGNLWSSHSAWRDGRCIGSGHMNALSFGDSDSMGDKLKFPVSNSAVMRSRMQAICLKVVCIDYPRPDIDHAVNFLEAAYLSSSFWTAPRLKNH